VRFGRHWASRTFNLHGNIRCGAGVILAGRSLVERQMQQRLLFALGVALVLFLGAKRTAADGPTRDYRVLDYTLEPDCFEDIATDVLELTPAQREEIAPQFEVYRRAIRELDLRSQKAADDAGWRELREREEARQRRVMNRAYDPNDPDFQVNPPTEEEVQLERRAVEAGNAGRREGDRLLFEFFEQLEKQLTAAQRTSLGRLPNIVWLHCWFNSPISAHPRDFGTHPDFRALVAAAMKPEGELAPWAFGATGLADEEFAAQEKIRTLLLEYEASMGAAIAQDRQKVRVEIAQPWVGKVVFLDDNSLEARQMMRDMGQSWANLYDVNRMSSEGLGDLLTKAGRPELAAKWLRRLQIAYAPRLFSDDVTDALRGWLAQQPGVTDAQIRLFLERLAQHLIEREAVRAAGFETIVARKRRGFSSSYPLDDPRRNETEERLKTIQDAMLRDFAAIVTEEQAEAYERFLESCVRHHRWYDLLYAPHQVAPNERP